MPDISNTDLMIVIASLIGAVAIGIGISSFIDRGHG